jgi:hypothetical protein
LEPEDYFLISLALFTAFIITVWFGYVVANPAHAGQIVYEEQGYIGSILLSNWISISAAALFSFALAIGFLIAGIVKKILKNKIRKYRSI